MASQVAVARLLLSAVWNRHGQMHQILQGDVRAMLTSRDGGCTHTHTHTQLTLVVAGSLQGPLWSACVTLIEIRSGVLPCSGDRLAEAVCTVQDEFGDEAVVLILVEELSSALQHNVSLDF
jgi:hypothetical protein